MPYFITIQYPYEYLTVTLAHDQMIVTTRTITKFQALSLLIPTIKALLEEHNLSLANLAYIAVNTGPGPFNTLRSVIATANSIHFAQKIPLITCDGFELMTDILPSQNCLILFDAFGTDVYYKNNMTGKCGYDSIHNILEQLHQQSHTTTVDFIGNGSYKHKDYIEQHALMPVQVHSDILFPSEHSIVKTSYKKYTAHDSSTELFPLYFASPVIKS